MSLQMDNRLPKLGIQYGKDDNDMLRPTFSYILNELYFTADMTRQMGAKVFVYYAQLKISIINN